jgi:ribosomal protein S27AE
MPLIRCSGCLERPEAKLSQVTWAWLNADRQRRAYRQRLCVQCFCTDVLALHQERPSGERLTCPGCHIDTEDDFDAVYITAYIPGAGKVQYELPTCGACAARVRIRAQQNAELLEDRAFESRGQAPGTVPSLTAAWEALGIVPRD